MSSIDYQCFFACTPEVLVRTLSEPRALAAWLGARCDRPPKVGAECILHFGSHTSDTAVLAVVELNTQAVRYRCKQAQLAGSMEWSGTELVFEFIPNIAAGTDLSFSHRGWQGRSMAYAQWTHAWDVLLNESLVAFIETGRGKPFFPNREGSGDGT
jgi:hypothetical protein